MGESENQSEGWGYPDNLRRSGFQVVIEVRLLEGELHYEAVAYLEPLPDGERSFGRLRVADAHANFYNAAHAGAAAAIQTQLDKLADNELRFGDLLDEGDDDD